MSLVAWYPLNKDFRNLGDSDFDITNTTNLPTINNNGKIGKTYHFSKTEYLTLNKGIVPNEETNFSCCYWIKELSGKDKNNFRVVYQCGNFIVGHWTSASGENRFDVYKGSGFDVSYKADTENWIHCCTTVSKEGVITLYLNGEKVKSGTVSSEFPISGSTTIGRRLNSGTNDYVDFLINDLRIYNHLLSEAEIKEISKAKILHYNFDSIYGNPNMLKNSNFNNLTTTGYVTKDYTYTKNGNPSCKISVSGATNNVYKGWGQYNLPVQPRRCSNCFNVGIYRR